MRINWRVRLRNKTWLAAMLALLTGFIYDLLALLGLTPAVEESWLMQLGETLLTLLTALGVVIDPTTKGAGDSERAMGY